MKYLESSFRSPANTDSYRKNWARVFGAPKKAVKPKAKRKAKPAPKPSRPNLYALNAARCPKCGTVARSRFRHDFASCKCGAISVDGGAHYLKRTGNVDFRSLQDFSRGPQPGDVFVVLTPFGTKAGITYDVGDELRLVERTDADPFKTGSTNNWVVACKYFGPGNSESVWVTFEQGFDAADGLPFYELKWDASAFEEKA